MSKPTDFLDSLDVTNVREHPEPEPKTPAADKPETEDEPVEDDEHDEEQDEQQDEDEKPAPKAAKVDSKAAPTAASEPKEAAGFKAGMLAERKKRQELEAKLRELEAKQKQPEQPAAVPVKFRDDPEQFVNSAMSAVEARLYNAMEADLREQHEDFDDVAALVVEASKLDPTLHAKVFEAGNPARAMYKLGKQLQEAEKLRDPEAYAESIREAVRAEEAAKLRKELGISDEDGKPARPNLPRDLSNGRSGTDQVASSQPADEKRGAFKDLFDTRRPST